MYSIHTWPSERFQQAMQFEVVENDMPLELVEWVLHPSLCWKLTSNLLSRPGPTPQLGPLLSMGGKTIFICNERLTEEQNSRGKAVFEGFVEDTVKAMIDLENSRRGDLTSSLQIFCRIDAGVLFRGGTCYYYISELERSLTTRLFQAQGTNVWTMLDSAVQRIPSYIHASVG